MKRRSFLKSGIAAAAASVSLKATVAIFESA
jgi:hypothetical protein